MAADRKRASEPARGMRLATNEAIASALYFVSSVSLCTVVAEPAARSLEGLVMYQYKLKSSNENIRAFFLINQKIARCGLMML